MSVENREGQLFSRTSYAYNSLDWLTGTTTQTKDATSNVSYDYDANGAQISQTTGAQSQTTGQKWDFEGHLLASGQVNAQGQWSGAKTTYSYDASGMRLSQASWNAAGVVTDGTSYVWDGDRVAEERDEKGVLQAVYEHGQELGPLRLTRRAGTLAAPVEQERYFIGDGQDSTRQLLDENGVVKDSYFYDAFGVGLPGGQGATENSFKYTGQQQDASGLYYLRARFYNAGTGRFLSQDPEMGSAMDPVSMHRYLYAGVDPVNMVDPTGREFTLAGAMTALSYTMKVYDGISLIGNVAGGGMEFALAWRDIQSGTGAPGMHVVLGAIHSANAALNMIGLMSPVPTFGGGPGSFGGAAAVMALENISMAQATTFAAGVGARVISQGVNGVMARNMEANLLMMGDGTGEGADTPLASTLDRYPTGTKVTGTDGGTGAPIEANFEGFFTAIFNRASKEIKIMPNIGEIYDKMFPRPNGYVGRSGGHTMVANGFDEFEAGTPQNNWLGFVFQRGEDGNLTIKSWKSIGANGHNTDFPGDVVPKEFRPEIAEYLRKQSGREVTITP